jgi:hypothetical protein
MSGKVELQRKLKDVGYEVGPFASKETLTNVMRSVGGKPNVVLFFTLLIV